MIFKGRRSGRIMNFTMSVSPGYKYFCRFKGCIKRYMLESEDVNSSISFKLKTKNIELVSFNGQSISFRSSIKKI